MFRISVKYLKYDTHVITLLQRKYLISSTLSCVNCSWLLRFTHHFASSTSSPSTPETISILHISPIPNDNLINTRNLHNDEVGNMIVISISDLYWKECNDLLNQCCNFYSMLQGSYLSIISRLVPVTCNCNFLLFFTW